MSLAGDVAQLLTGDEKRLCDPPSGLASLAQSVKNGAMRRIEVGPGPFLVNCPPCNGMISPVLETFSLAARVLPALRKPHP
jgi:hypothetical protein